VHLSVVQRILGVLLLLFSLTMLPPLGVSLYYSDGNWSSFAESFVGLLLVGSGVWWPVRAHTRDLRVRDGFLVVSLFWVVLGLAGATPFVLASRPDLSLTDAVFEAVSGFTTTGATVLIGLDSMPPSLLYYRQQIQWFGGLGMVVLAVALLPMLKIGGMQLLRAETPGPIKDAKLTPRITETAKILWLVYLLMTMACAACYWLAGMSVFDAVTHSFSTLSTGGFSTHDPSFGFFDSAVIEAIAILFMFLGGVNFSLHYLVWQRRSIGEYFRDAECKAFVGVLASLIFIYTVALWLADTKPDLTSALRASAFQVVSLQTSTGFISEDFTLWPAAIPVLLILFSFLGGCAGSTAGGMKIIRWVLLWKQGKREITKLLHPAAVLPVKLGGKPVSVRVVEAVWGFFAVYVLSFGALMVALLLAGEDQVTAFSAIATCMNNMGPGLGAVSANFATVTPAGKWVCIVAMLLGRLEVFPLLVLVAPSYWRQ
jgi:trk system potassium uptake protein TrkH